MNRINNDSIYYLLWIVYLNNFRNVGFLFCNRKKSPFVYKGFKTIWVIIRKNLSIILSIPKTAMWYDQTCLIWLLSLSCLLNLDGDKVWLVNWNTKSILKILIIIIFEQICLTLFSRNSNKKWSNNIENITFWQYL